MSPTPPVAPAGRDLGDQDLDPLLLPLEEIREIMAAPGLEVDQTYTQMPPSTAGYDPEQCVRAGFNTVELGYRDSGFVATRGVVMQEPAAVTQVLHLVDEGVVTFPTAAAASDYLTKTVDAWRQCAGKPFSVLRGETVDRWTFGEISENGGVSAIPKRADGSEWSCSHAIAARANVVIDVSACGFSVTDQATTIVARIRDKFPA